MAFVTFEDQSSTSEFKMSRLPFPVFERNIANVLLFVAMVFALQQVCEAQQKKFNVGQSVFGVVDGTEFKGMVLRVRGNEFATVRFFDKSGGTFEETISVSELRKTSKVRKQRLWLSKSGKFKVNATLLDFNDRIVVLQKEDGARINVQIDQLSAFDKKYLNSIELDPDAPKKPLPQEMLKLKKISNEHVKQIRTTLTTKWEVAPFAQVKATAPVIPQFIPEAFHLEPSTQIGLKGLVSFSSMAISDDGMIATVMQTVESPKVTQSFVQVANLAKQNSVAFFMVPNDGIVECVTENWFVTNHRNKKQINFWSTETGKHLAGWQTKNSLKMIRPIDEDHMATFDEQGRFVLWQWKRTRPIYQIACKLDCIPSFSEDRKIVGIAFEKGIGIHLLKTGALLGTIKTSDIPRNIAFSPDGMKLAFSSASRIEIVDLINGMIVQEIFKESPGHKSLEWAGSEHVLVNHRSLINTQLGLQTWVYTGGDAGLQLRRSTNGYFWYARREYGQPGGVMIPVSIPNEAVLRSERNLSSPVNQVLPLDASFAIDVSNLQFDKNQRLEVARHLESQLERKNRTVDPDSDFVLRAVVETGTPETAIYEFRPHITQAVRFTPSDCRIELRHRGIPIWSKTVVSEPAAYVKLEGNESLNAYAQRASIPRPFHFKLIKIPMSLSKLPLGQASLGTTDLTINGPKATH